VCAYGCSRRAGFLAGCWARLCKQQRPPVTCQGAGACQRLLGTYCRCCCAPSSNVVCSCAGGSLAVLTPPGHPHSPYYRLLFCQAPGQGPVLVVACAPPLSNKVVLVALHQRSHILQHTPQPQPQPQHSSELGYMRQHGACCPARRNSMLIGGTPHTLPHIGCLSTISGGCMMTAAAAKTS
jgi:hypothetical protein